ncbi:MAG: DUF3368 domain-containing protein [Saprospiraceae bacterium]|nr:DUF3368 domain-containing protein [Saprospiraceae bacterium]
MESVIISDTSCLIVLEKIDRLSLLKELYSQVVVTPIVAKEFDNELPNWFKVISPSNSSLQKMLEETIDPGESESIALAMETPDCLLILDDLRARKVATSLGLAFTGTLGVIAAAKRQGIIAAARPVFDQLRATDFRLSDSFLEVVLHELGE